MRKTLLSVCCALAAVWTGGCASSSARLIDSYRAPGTVSLVFERVAVFVMNGGPELRGTLEDDIVRGSGSPRLIAAHSVLAGDEMRSVSTIRRTLLDKKFDGIVTLRLLRPDEIDPASTYAGESFSTYAGSVSPGEPAFGKGNIRIETSFYDLADEKLVWRGIVESNQNDPHEIARGVVYVIGSRLRQTGLVHD